MIFKNMDGKLEAFSSTGADDALLAHVRAAVELPANSHPELSRPGSMRGCARSLPATPISTSRRRGRCARPIRNGCARCCLPVHGHSRSHHCHCPDRAHRRGQGAGPDGHSGDQRGFTAFAHAGWYMERVATGEALAQPVGAFPRLELPAEEGASA
jgi:methionyl-tRNA synthetase